MSAEAALKAIHAELVLIRQGIDKLVKAPAFAPPARQNTTPSGSASGDIASDQDLDGQYGNPAVRFELKEKYWPGDSFVGYTFSECPPEYLDATARYLDACVYMANKSGDEEAIKKATYKAKDAARARGWAKRIRAGWEPAAQPDGFATSNGALAPTGGYSNDDDIPF